MIHVWDMPAQGEKLGREMVSARVKKGAGVVT